MKTKCISGNFNELIHCFKVINEIEANKTCSMLKAVEVADKSRSTVYKTIRKLVAKNILEIENSSDDKRSFLLKPLI